jgi:hypothetical protein
MADLGEAQREELTELSGATLIEVIQEASEAFELMMQERHDAGAEKYGPAKFLTVDTIDEALAELVDLANYARFTFIKLVILKIKLQEVVATAEDSAGIPDRPQMLGASTIFNPQVKG